MYSAGMPGDVSRLRMSLTRHQVTRPAGIRHRTFHAARGAGCSSGNQSGGFALPAIADASSSLLLPATRTTFGTFGSGGCTLSGMLYAHSGSPLGIVVGVGFCAATTDVKEDRAEAGR